MEEKKTVETVVENIETEVKTAAAEITETVKTAEKAAKKAAAKAEETVEKAEKAAKKTAKKVEEKTEEVVEKAEAKAEAVKQTVKAAKPAKDAGKKPEKKADGKKGGKDKGGAARPFTEKPRMKLRYNAEVVPALQAKFGYKNPMQIPKLEKIIINMGLGSDKDNPKSMEVAVKELGTIAGQKAVITKAKKSVANFKVREGMNIGAKVTLRGDRMYYFADKLINIVLPRVRDFRGVSAKSFDGRGNYAMGLKEQLIFPEINYDDVDKVRGMNIVFVTSAQTDEECKELLAQLGMPFVQG